MKDSKFSVQGFIAVLSLLSALGVAFIGYMSVNLQTEVENLDKKIKHEELMLEIKKFEATQKQMKEKLITSIVPKIVSGNGKEKDEVLALLFVLYPNDAEEILRRVGSALNQDSANKFSDTIQRASEINIDTGEWGIVISSDSELTAANHEVEKAKKHNYSASIYKRGRWFATVIGPFPNEVNADKANIAIRRNLNDTSFIINFKKWCGKQVKNKQYYECKT
ncbi:MULTISPECIES: hypothetical protein [unclassified Pseudoalteromonas]|uniref:hypothetical protein n=1 Tax=unclassified Pseudoalteromonas TaxID=194690 RepID=UPI000BBEB88D|nr:hypothetical protein [Pseudoalteromonas sp. 1_2015MBL_MicDiv]ATG79762.1 hypothetical protein AOR04_19675 [Pseudoalteromonas sp. 1_2015MBL_MicDiv]